MGRKKAVVVLPHLIDAGGDMNKTWYVEYSMRDPYTNQLKRFRELLHIFSMGIKKPINL